MTQAWPFLVVRDVHTSSSWYQKLLGARSPLQPDSPHRAFFDQLVDAEGRVLLCLLSWKDHELPWTPGEGRVGIGSSLYFVVDDFDAAWSRAQELAAEVEQEPVEQEQGFATREFVVHDCDGFRISIGDANRGYLAEVTRQTSAGSA